MWRELMLTRVLLRDNDSRGVELRERFNDVRPPLLARRSWALGSLVLALFAFAGWLPLSPTWQTLLIIVAVTNEAEIISLRGARDVASLDRRVAIFAFAYASVAGAVTYAAGDAEFAGALAFALVLAGAGTALRARPLFAVTAYSLLLFGSEAIGELSGIIPAEDFAGPSPVSAHDVAELVSLLVAMFILPAISLVTYGTTQRLRTARRQAEMTAAELRAAEQAVIESREQLKAWNEQLDGQMNRKTAELEEQNRYLAVINAVSFALSGPMDETGAVERASRLIARVLDVRAVQLYILPPDDQLPQLMLVAADPNAEAGALPESLMRRVADDSEPLHEPGGRSEAGPLPDGGQPPDAGDAFAIVPLVAKGRTIGSFAVLGERPQGWNDDELHLLMLIGRELGMALENERLYDEALDSVAQESLLSDVVRTLVTTEDAGRALSQALDLVASRIGARFAAVVTRPDGALRPTVLARYANGEANDDLHAVDHALLAAPAIVADRTRPLVLGDRGEGPVSAALAAEGIGTFVLVPIVGASSDRDDVVADDPHDKARTKVMQTMTATLAVAAGPEVSWGQRQIDLLSRLSSVIARRMETDNLLRLQERRITELSGLAEVAATVQSTIDPERLYSGFARALYTLADYRRLYVARLDAAGDLTQAVCFGPGGRPLPSPSFEAVDNRHAWFGQRGMERWSAADAAPPSFIESEDRHGLVVPLRPKGQILGVVVITTREAPRQQYGTLVVQAVEQLALALDSAALYRQATERAARIQVLGNLAAIVASVLDLREAFDAFAEEVRWLIPFDRALMLLVEEDAATMQTYARYPEDRTVSTDVQPLAGSLASVAAQAGGPVAFSRSDIDGAPFDWSAFDVDIEEVVAVPVVDKGVCTAVFALGRTSAQRYGPEELTVLEEVAGLLAVTIDRLRLYERAEYNARHDLLTGLPNQRFLDERLAELRAGLTEDGSSALLMTDMDELKVFNDTLGHDAGDRVLQVVARELREACRADDFVARVGGDEFVVVMEHADLEAATSVATRIHEGLRDAHMEIPGAPTRIQISIGVAVASNDGASVAELLHAADSAMYDAKFAGGRHTRVAGDQNDVALAHVLNRRPNRVVEVLVHAATVGASEGERAALAVAQRYAVSSALDLGMSMEATTPLRMLVAATAAGRLADPSDSIDQSTAMMLLDGLRDEWRDRDAATAALCAQLVPASVTLAWLQAPSPVGAGMPLDEALKRLRRQPPPDATDQIIGALEAAAGREAVDRRAGGRAA